MQILRFCIAEQEAVFYNEADTMAEQSPDLLRQAERNLNMGGIKMKKARTLAALLGTAAALMLFAATVGAEEAATPETSQPEVSVVQQEASDGQSKAPNDVLDEDFESRLRAACSKTGTTYVDLQGTVLLQQAEPFTVRNGADVVITVKANEGHQAFKGHYEVNYRICIPERFSFNGPLFRVQEGGSLTIRTDTENHVSSSLEVNGDYYYKGDESIFSHPIDGTFISVEGGSLYLDRVSFLIRDFRKAFSLSGGYCRVEGTTDVSSWCGVQCIDDLDLIWNEKAFDLQNGAKLVVNKDLYVGTQGVALYASNSRCELSGTVIGEECVDDIWFNGEQGGAVFCDGSELIAECCSFVSKKGTGLKMVDSTCSMKKSGAGGGREGMNVSGNSDVVMEMTDLDSDGCGLRISGGQCTVFDDDAHSEIRGKDCGIEISGDAVLNLKGVNVTGREEYFSLRGTAIRQMGGVCNITGVPYQDPKLPEVDHILSMIHGEYSALEITGGTFIADYCQFDNRAFGPATIECKGQGGADIRLNQIKISNRSDCFESLTNPSIHSAIKLSAPCMVTVTGAETQSHIGKIRVEHPQAKLTLTEGVFFCHSVEELQPYVAAGSVAQQNPDFDTPVCVIRRQVSDRPASAQGVLTKGEDGNFYLYSSDGTLIDSYSGLAPAPDGTSYLVRNGVADLNDPYVGLIKHEDGWYYYVNHARVDNSFTGLLMDENGDFRYLVDGACNAVSDYEGLVRHVNGWFYYVKDGKIDFTKTGLVPDGDLNFWYVVKGEANTTSPDAYAVRHEDGLWYAIRGGMWQKEFAGTLKDGNGVAHTFVNGRADA